VTYLVFHPRAARWLAVASWAVCAVFVVGLATTATPAQIAAYVAWGPWFALVIWLMFWRPDVRVDESGVAARNPLRTWQVPWALIQRVDTKYSLTLFTPQGRVQAWAAPAASRRAVRLASPADVAHLPSSTYGPGGGVRPGDLLASDSGQVALVVREHWEALRDEGRLHPAADDAVTRGWHIPSTVGLVAVTVLAVALTALFH